MSFHSETMRVVQSGLFDQDWYLQRYPDLAMLRVPALWHFMWQGWREMRSPSRFFIVEHFLSELGVLELPYNPVLFFLDGQCQLPIPMPTFKVESEALASAIGQTAEAIDFLDFVALSNARSAAAGPSQSYGANCAFQVML